MSDQGLLLERLQKLGPPEPHLMGAIRRTPTAVSVQESRFEVYGYSTVLRPPIDWLQDPYGNRSWCYELHTLAWLKPILCMHAEYGHRAALTMGLNIIVDWVSAHIDHAKGISEFAWYDMAVGLRAPCIAYALRAGLAEDILSRDRASLLLEACNRHGIELANDRNYSADHNHGLFQDEGLYLLARQLSILPAAPAWTELVVDRLHRTLKATICEREGSHLEHSSAYQFSIVDLVSRLARVIEELPMLDELRERLRQTAAWHVTPSETISQLGDTDNTPAAEWARRGASKLRGLKALYESGYAFVRDGDGYLAVSTGYHSPAHKQADGTGFLLVEGRQVLLGDAGRWGYYEEEPDRRYARSAHAHNVLTVDDQDHAWRDSDPYESGLLAAGEGHGWYAILVANPLLSKQGVEHRRLLLYRPTEVLVVIDDVRAEKHHDYDRRFHFGSEFEAKLDKQGHVIVMGKKFTATLTHVGDETEIALDRGRDEPTRMGWTYPGDRKRVPVWTATMRSRAADATLTAALRLGHGASPVVTQAKFEATRAVVEINGGAVEVRFASDQSQAEVRVENSS